MKTKNLLLFTYAIITIGILLLAGVVVLLVLNENHLNKSQENRYLSYLRASELRQSSDDLTRFARTYVVTKDTKYEKMYWDIVDIRNGKKPRPQNYEKFIDLVLNYGDKPRDDGKPEVLLKMMEELGFTTKSLTY